MYKSCEEPSNLTLTLPAPPPYDEITEDTANMPTVQPMRILVHNPTPPIPERTVNILSPQDAHTQNCHSDPDLITPATLRKFAEDLEKMDHVQTQVEDKQQTNTVNDAVRRFVAGL